MEDAMAKTYAEMTKEELEQLYAQLDQEYKDAKGKGLALAFLFNDNRLWESDKLDQRLSQALEKLVETLSQQ